MIPHDLPEETLRLQATEEHSIVLLTGGEDLRHERFGLRMQQAFGDRVKAWLHCGLLPGYTNDSEAPANAPGVLQRGAHKLSTAVRVAQRLQQEPWRAVAREVRQQRKVRDFERRLNAAQREAEAILFGHEMNSLREGARVAPEWIDDPNAPEVVARMQDLSPYLLLTLGGPLYRRPLLATVRGLAINQHAGWSPDYKGCMTTQWALYHRDLAAVGATVHVIGTGADDGPILRRGHPCLNPEDDMAMCFARVVALGTELMIEVVDDAIAGRPLNAYRQPKGSGRTYLARDFDNELVTDIERDFDHRWLPKALSRMKSF